MRFGRAPLGAAIVTLWVGLGSRAHAAEPPLSIGDAADALPPRPALPPAPPTPPLPWLEHLEVGGGLAVIGKLPAASTDAVRLSPGAGFHIRVSWEVFRYLWFTGTLVESVHGLRLPAGSLGLPGELHSGSAQAYTLGASLSPTLPLGPRVRVWLTLGAGWGHLAYPAIKASQAGSTSALLRGRDAYVVELPFGLGAAFEIVPRWLRVHLELTGALLPSQTGPALESGQTIVAGKILDVRPMPRLGFSATQLIGISLVL